MQLITDKSLLEQKSHGDFRFPILVSYENITKYDYGTFCLHWHPEIEITLVTSGEMLYKINNKIITLKENDILFCNSGALHSGKKFNNQECTYCSLTFDSKIIYGYKNSALYEKYVSPILQNLSFSYLHLEPASNCHKFLMNNISNIISLYSDTPQCYEMDIIISLQHIWKNIYNQLSLNENIPEIEALNLSRIRAITSYVELNYCYKISLTDIAKHINLCEAECCRIFKSIMNISIFDYIQEYRILKACEYLSRTGYSIREIAGMVGYNDSNHFSKVFKKYKHITPSLYKKSVKNECEA